MSSRKSFDADTARAIGARIREIRGETTQTVFAEGLGVDRATLANYESGRRLPNDAILKRLSSISGRSIPDLIFGETITPFSDYIRRINEQIAREVRERPGYIPRWSLSDDELAIITLLRVVTLNEARDLLEQLVRRASGAIEQDKAMTSLPVYGEGELERLRARLDSGQLQEGFDPDRALFSTLQEELAARKGPQ